MELWRNGEQVIDWRGMGTAFNDQPEYGGKPPFMKLGVYKWGWKKRQEYDVTGSEVVFSEIRVGDGSSSFAEVNTVPHSQGSWLGERRLQEAVPCDADALAEDSAVMLATCCPEGTERGPCPPPGPCSAACAGAFITFVDTYNHGGCQRALQKLGDALHLGDLEASCREAISTDGGADASAADCSPAVGIEVALACSRTSVTGSTFCASPCYAALSPFMELCSAMIPKAIQMMLQPALALLAGGQCSGPSAAGVGDGRCNLDLVASACQLNPSLACGRDMSCVCALDCTQEMLDCLDSPALADDRASLQATDHSCRELGMRNGPIGAGNGQCRLASAQDFCRGFDPEFEDASVCNHPCVQEMIDCIDSPVLANSRDAVELMRDTCTGPAAGCVPIIFDMGTFFGEACCSGAGQACADGPPAVCTAGCAAIFLPFMEQCGAVMRDPDTGIAPEMASAMASFRGVCARSHPAKGGGGH